MENYKKMQNMQKKSAIAKNRLVRFCKMTAELSLTTSIFELFLTCLEFAIALCEKFDVVFMVE